MIGLLSPLLAMSSSHIIQKTGIIYSHPFHTTDTNDNKSIFAGGMAVDYTLMDISAFLAKNYGGQDDLVVTTFDVM